MTAHSRLDSVNHLGAPAPAAPPAAAFPTALEACHDLRSSLEPHCRSIVPADRRHVARAQGCGILETRGRGATKETAPRTEEQLRVSRRASCGSQRRRESLPRALRRWAGKLPRIAEGRAAPGGVRAEAWSIVFPARPYRAAGAPAWVPLAGKRRPAALFGERRLVRHNTDAAPPSRRPHASARAGAGRRPPRHRLRAVVVAAASDARMRLLPPPHAVAGSRAGQTVAVVQDRLGSPAPHSPNDHRRPPAP